MRIKSLLLGLVTATALGGAWLPASASPFVATADFQAAAQAAPWSYGYDSGSGFVPFSATKNEGGVDLWYVSNPSPRYDLPGIGANLTGAPIVWTNPSAGTTVTIPTSLLLMHPYRSAAGVDFDAIVRFTAPTTAMYGVAATFQALDSRPTSIFAEILLNGTLLASRAVDSGAGTTWTYGPATLLSMAAGDTLDFRVGPGGPVDNYFFFDSTGFDATITVPEPSLVSLLGLGLLGVALARRRRDDSRAGA